MGEGDWGGEIWELGAWRQGAGARRALIPVSGRGLIDGADAGAGGDRFKTSMRTGHHQGTGNGRKDRFGDSDALMGEMIGHCENRIA